METTYFWVKLEHNKEIIRSIRIWIWQICRSFSRNQTHQRWPDITRSASYKSFIWSAFEQEIWLSVNTIQSITVFEQPYRILEVCGPRFFQDPPKPGPARFSFQKVRSETGPINSRSARVRIGSGRARTFFGPPENKYFKNLNFKSKFSTKKSIFFYRTELPN